MPDVFISYNREDRERASLIASALEAEGFSVWWDAALRAGETYDEVTEQNLRTAGAVVVLWSKRSSNSKWVRAEATVGERSSTLVPALIEDCERPIRFELVQTADLRHWRGDRADPHWRAFMQDVRTAITRRNTKAQPTAAPAGADASFETTFWNSIKDGKDRADFEAYLKRYPNGNFAALAHNRIAALARSTPPQSSQPAPQPRQSVPQAARSTVQPRAAAPAPAAAPKKSGNGLLIAGVVAGLAVLSGVAFMMLNKPDDAETVAESAPPVVEPPAEVASSAPEAADDVSSGGVDGVAAADALEETVEAVAEPIVETPPVEETTPQPFRDCESCPLMTPLPGGVFTMGSPSSEPGHNAYEGPQREVTVKPFAIGVYELTEAEWQACVADGACKTKPKSGEEPNLPALYLSWRDANDYVAWLSKKSGRKYRLPTEAEWEYAARGGATTAYWWGDSFDRARVSSNAAGVVGAFSANAFGLYDVAANAREWVADCYVNNFAKAPVDGSAVTDGDCGKRVIRGGAWLSAPVDMRVANRSRIDIGVRARYMGVRLAAEIE